MTETESLGKADDKLHLPDSTVLTTANWRRPKTQLPSPSANELSEELLQSITEGMAALQSPCNSGHPKVTSDGENDEIWLAQWVLSSADAPTQVNHRLTTRTWRRAIKHITAWIGGPRVTHWAIEIRDFRYELQRFGYWPFFWHAFIQIERKEVRKRKPFRKIHIGRTNLSDIEIWAAARQTSGNCRAYTQLWDNCQQIMLDHFLPIVAADARTRSRPPSLSELLRYCVILAYVAHLLPFLAKEYGFRQNGKWAPPSPIASFFGIELLLLLLMIHPSKALASFGESKREICVKAVGTLAGWMGICFIYFYYRFAISLYGNALCWLESTVSPPFSLSFLPKARVWTSFGLPLEQQDHVLSLFLPLLSSCKLFWWVFQFAVTLQTILVVLLVVVQFSYLLLLELDPARHTQILLTGCKLDVACGFWQALRQWLGMCFRAFGIGNFTFLGQEKDDDVVKMIGTGLPKGQEDRRRVVFFCF